MASSPSSSGIDKSLFGTGYQSDTEKTSTFLFTSDHITFDEDKGVGGAIPIQGYKGPWPIFPDFPKVTWADVENSAAGPSEIVSAKSAAKKKAPRMVCKSTGRCSACPKNERHRPYCQPYGNKAPVECRPITVLEAPKKPVASAPQMASSKSKQQSSTGISEKGIDGQALQMLSRQEESVISSVVYKGYQTCGRDRVQEAWDYSEFIGINLLLALGGLFLLVKRQRLLAGQHQAMLARRIGRI